MRIGIDARAAAEVRGGRGTVVRELVRALPADTDYVLFARERTPHAAPERWVLTREPDPAWNVRVGLTAHRHCDVLLCTNSYLTAWFTRIPSVIVVHDLVAFEAVHRADRRTAVIERATLPLAVRRATLFTAVSQATADDLVRRFPAARGRVTVTHLAADRRFFATEGPAPEDVATRHGITKPYVLVVATLEPRKNLARLIDAFAALPDDVREGHELVLVGAKGWQTGETFSAIERHRHLVRALGHVDDADLVALYRGAALFAYPSLYEGFGLPVLEAMAAGAPVLTSRVSSLPEVAGEAAFYCDPWDVSSIRAGLEEGLTDRARAAQLAAAGRERAASFSWERHAREVVAVCERAVEMGRRAWR